MYLCIYVCIYGLSARCRFCSGLAMLTVCNIFIRLLIYVCVYSLFIYLFMYSFIIYLFIYPFMHLCINAIIYSCIDVFIYLPLTFNRSSLLPSLPQPPSFSPLLRTVDNSIYVFTCFVYLFIHLFFIYLVIHC